MKSPHPFLFIMSKLYNMVKDALQFCVYDIKESFGVLSFITEFKTRKEQV